MGHDDDNVMKVRYWFAPQRNFWNATVLPQFRYHSGILRESANHSYQNPMYNFGDQLDGKNTTIWLNENSV